MLDRKTPPPFVKSTSFDLIQPVKHHLPNGVDVFFIQGGSQDVARIELIFKAGRWYETEPGASHFAANLLTKGTGNKTSFQIAQIFDQYGASVEIHPGLDFISVSVYSLTQYLSPVLLLLVEILHEASFPEKELDQHRTIYIQNLKVNNEKTSFLASKLFRKNLFGENHPYGKELEEHHVSALKQQHLLDHFKSYFTEVSVFVSGKIEPSSERLLVDIFSGWHAPGITEKSFAVTPFKETFQCIEKEGSVQSSIRTGKRSVRRSDPDYPCAIFVSHLLGGYFGSRLMKNIREEKGLTYGIYASISPLQRESYMAIGADVNKENVELTLAEIRKELKNLRTEKISFDELETARNHFVGSLQSEISTPFAHADKLKTIYLFDLPQDYYQRLINTINAITPAQIIDISEKHFHEDTFYEVAVG